MSQQTNPPSSPQGNIPINVSGAQKDFVYIVTGIQEGPSGTEIFYKRPGEVIGHVVTIPKGTAPGPISPPGGHGGYVFRGVRHGPSGTEVFFSNPSEVTEKITIPKVASPAPSGAPNGAVFYDPHTFYSMYEHGTRFKGKLDTYAKPVIPSGAYVKRAYEKPDNPATTQFDPELILEFGSYAYDENVAESVSFFKSIKFPQFGGKLSPFEIPAGAYVKDIVEFPDNPATPEDESQFQVIFSTPEQDQAEAESIGFYESIGYPQFAGKYAPFKILGDFKLVSLTEVPDDPTTSENEARLEAQFESLVAQGSREFYAGIGYPQFGGKYAPIEIPAGHKLVRLTEIPDNPATPENEAQLEAQFESLMPVYSPEEQAFLAQEMTGLRLSFLTAGPRAWTQAQSQIMAQAPPSQATVDVILQRLLATTTSPVYDVGRVPINIGAVSPAVAKKLGAVAYIEAIEYAYPSFKVTGVAPQVTTSPVYAGQIQGDLGYILTLTPKISPAIVSGSVLAQAQDIPIAVVTPGELRRQEQLSGLGSVVVTGTTRFDPVTQQIVALSQQDFIIAGAVTAGLAAGAFAPAVALKGAIIGVGLQQGIVGVTERRFLTPEEALISAGSGAALIVGTQYIFQGAARILPVFASKGASGMAARAGLSAGLGAAVGTVGEYATTGKVSGVGTLEGAAFAAGASIAVEFGGRAFSYIRGKLSGYERMQRGAQAIGKAGEPVETWVSEPIESLDGRRLQIVEGVTMDPVGYKGVTLQSMIDEYVGQTVPTGHATLSPASFELSAGGKTLLKGISGEAMGFRSAQQLFHFYNAPGSEEFVTVYGGYAGVGQGYSDLPPKIVFGGKPTALVTTGTVVSPEFLKQAGESLDDYLARVSSLSGKTGIAPETLISRSIERQLITPAQYTRFGEQLPGSLFISGGKVGTFQIVQPPTGILGKIPVLRQLFSEYTNLTVYKGTFAPATGSTSTVAKVLSLPSYGASYGRTVSLSRLSLVPSILPVFVSPRRQASAISKATQISPSQFVSPKSTSSKNISSLSRSVPSWLSLPMSSFAKSAPSIPSIPVSPLPSIISGISSPLKSFASASSISRLRSSTSIMTLLFKSPPISYPPETSPPFTSPPSTSSPPISPSKLTSPPIKSPPTTTLPPLDFSDLRRLMKRTLKPPHGYGRYPRQYPIMTGEQMLREVVAITPRRRRR